VVPIQSQTNPLHNLPPYFPKIHSNIIHPYTCRYSDWSLPFKCNDQSFVFTCHLPKRAICPAHLTLLDLITLIILEKRASYGAPHYAVFSIPNLFLACPNILLSTLFSNILNLCSSLRARDQVSHPARRQIDGS
jgi:hypothetical protein